MHVCAQIYIFACRYRLRTHQVCKRAPLVAYEAMECHGGNGWVHSPLPSLQRGKGCIFEYPSSSTPRVSTPVSVGTAPLHTRRGEFTAGSRWHAPSAPPPSAAAEEVHMRLTGDAGIYI